MQTVRSTKKISRPHESICSKATKSEIGIIVCSSWLTLFAHCAVEIRLEHFFMAFLHCPYQVDDFRILECLNLTFLAWDMRLKWLKIWRLAPIFAHCAVKNSLEHFSMASLHCPYQVVDFRLLKCLNSTSLAWNMRLKRLKIWRLAPIFAHSAVKNSLEHFPMASLHCPYQVDDFRLLECLNPTILARDMRLKWLKIWW